MNLLAALCIAFPQTASPAEPVRVAPARGSPQAAVRQADESKSVTHGDQSVVVYDVHDLLAPRRKGPAGQLEALLERKRAAAKAEREGRQRHANDAPSESSTRDAEPSPESERAAQQQLLVAYLKCLGARVHDDKFHVDSRTPGTLVVHARTSTFAMIEALMRQLRERRDEAVPSAAVEVEMSAFWIDEDGREELEEFVEEQSGTKVDGNVVTMLAPELVARFVARGEQVDAMMVPRLIVNPLERFEVSTGSEVAYVASFDQVTIEGIGTIVDPVVKTLREGVALDGYALASAPLPGLAEPPFALQVTLDVAKLRRPIETAKTDLGVIQLPEVSHASFSTTIAGSLGATFVVGGVPSPRLEGEGEARRLYLLVTVRRASGAWSEGGAPAEPAPTKRDQ